MTPKRFFRLCLLLPLVVPLALVPFRPTNFTTLLWAAPVLAGIPYLVFAAVLFVWLGRLRSLGQSQVLSLGAPLLFLPFLGVYLTLVAWVSTPHAHPVSKAWGLTFDVSGLGLLTGYVYVALANAIALILKWLGALEVSNP